MAIAQVEVPMAACSQCDRQTRRENDKKQDIGKGKDKGKDKDKDKENNRTRHDTTQHKKTTEDIPSYYASSSGKEVFPDNVFLQDKSKTKP